VCYLFADRHKYLNQYHYVGEDNQTNDRSDMSISSIEAHNASYSNVGALLCIDVLERLLHLYSCDLFKRASLCSSNASLLSWFSSGGTYDTIARHVTACNKNKIWMNYKRGMWVLKQKTIGNTHFRHYSALIRNHHTSIRDLIQ